MNQEIWKDVVDYEGIYEVSNLGRVRTKEGKKTYSVRHGERIWKSRILKEKNKKGRDVRVSLWKDKICKDFLVHRLVCFAFLDKPLGKDYVNHIDGNPRNNKLENLEWCNHHENNNHAFDEGLMFTYFTLVKNIINGEEIKFRSITKAAEFLGMKQGTLNGRLKRGENIQGNYKVSIIKKELYYENNRK